MTGRAFLGLGSNLGDRLGYLRDAVATLREVGLVGVSPVYETRPVGGPAARTPTSTWWSSCADGATPHDLLGVCHRLEAAAGRCATSAGAPTLDVDVLWIDGDGRRPDLVVPHPRMWERRFVLAPLHDLAPDLVDEAALAASSAGRRRARSTSVRSTSCPRAAPWLRASGSSGRAGRARRWPWPSPTPAGTWRPARSRRRPRRPPQGVDLLVLATPDDRVRDVARAVEPDETTVVAHLAGRRASALLAPHRRRRPSTRWWRCPRPSWCPAPGRFLVRGGRRPAGRRGGARAARPMVQVADADRPVYRGGRHRLEPPGGADGTGRAAGDAVGVPSRRTSTWRPTRSTTWPTWGRRRR